VKDNREFAVRKKRVLISAESSFLNSGYGVMTAEIARRLHATGRYEVAELASYLAHGDERINQVPWRVYPVMPHEQDRESRQRYESDPLNQFGKFVWEPVVLDFLPDCILGFRDTWYEQHVFQSPLRPYYSILYMAPCDAAPQKADWLYQFGQADALFTYTDWAAKTIEEQAGGSIKVCGVTPPGVDYNTFQPRPNRLALRQAFGIPEEHLVVGFVARNQQRKRFPELAQAFRGFLNRAHPSLAANSYMYWHTAWPDLGWDIPYLLKEFGLSSRVYFTYRCTEPRCRAVFASPWMDVVNVCRNCGGPTAYLPNTRAGIHHADLAAIYNLFDVYVQYASSEGIGIPQMEAAACGVPLLSVNYSGMEDVVTHLNATPLEVQSYFTEVETGCRRAIPDGWSLLHGLEDLLSKSRAERARLGFLAREAAMKRYNWDRLVDRWSATIDVLEPACAWGQSQQQLAMVRDMPQELRHPSRCSDFVRWGFSYVAGRPDLAFSPLANRVLRDLNWGKTLTGSPNWLADDSFLGRNHQVQDVNHESLMRLWWRLAEEKNHWESARWQRMRS
jgi:glycosyltransferase involved in cell wall biosynthesis